MDVGKAAAKYEKRKDAVEAVMRGEPVSVVARVYAVPQRTIFGWLARYRAGGWHALEEGRRSGRPRKVSAETMQWLYEAITLGDPRQFQLVFCLWTLNIVRTVLKKEKGVELSKSAVCRLLQYMGLTPQRPIYRSYKQDPQELERYLNKTFPELRALAQRTGAEIYFVDESAVRSDHHRGRTLFVMALVIVDHLQKRSAVQAEKADDFKQGKTTAGLLAATLRPLTLIGSGIRHRQTRATDDFDPATQPELIVANLAFELLGHLRANLLEYCLLKSRASLTVGAGIS